VGIEENPGPERLTPYQRWKIVFLKEQKKTNVNIAREVKCERHTVADVLKRYQETDTVDEKQGRGRKRKLSTERKKKVYRKAKQRKSARKIAAEITKEEIPVDERTIRRTLKEQKFFFLPPKKIQRISKGQKKKRLAYAKEMKDFDWKIALFTDEKSFWLGCPSDPCWQQLDSRIVEEIQRYTPKLHVWGAIGYYFKTKLYFFVGNMNAKLYQKIVSERLPPTDFAPDCPEEVKGNWHFLQDNDPKHKAKGSMKLLRELTGLRLIKHPPNSPDLNPMEDVWSYLDRHVRASRVTTINGLKRKLSKLWNDLPWTEFHPSIISMPARLGQCITRRGGRTDY
jgi:transposase